MQSDPRPARRPGGRRRAARPVPGRWLPDAPRLALVASAVVLILIGLGVALALLHRPGPAPAPRPAGAPVPTPDGLSRDQLRPADLGPAWLLSGPGSTGSPDWPWDQSAVCPGYRAADYPAQSHRRAARALAFTDPVGDGVRQVVEQFEPDWAQRSLADVRRVLASCASYPGPGGTVGFRILADGLAGPDSLLVAGTAGTGSTTYFLVVRDETVVSTVQVPDALGEPFARQLAAVLSARTTARRSS